MGYLFDLMVLGISKLAERIVIGPPLFRKGWRVSRLEETRCDVWPGKSMGPPGNWKFKTTHHVQP
jgi:hypothetical protein